MSDVAAAVRAKLDWKTIPDPEPSPAEILPPDAGRDVAETRRLLRTL